MNKVYFDTEKKVWFVNEPEELYLFKSVNQKTNEETNQIISWTRNKDLENYPHHIRMYDFEIDDQKIFFLMKLDGDRYILESENPLDLETLLNDNDIFFVGETLS